MVSEKGGLEFLSDDVDSESTVIMVSGHVEFVMNKRIRISAIVSATSWNLVTVVQNDGIPSILMVLQEVINP